VTDEVPSDVAERRYERWVMRAADLVWGTTPTTGREPSACCWRGCNKVW
jgi:hypothetical protein